MKQILILSLLLTAAYTTEQPPELACAENNDQLILPSIFYAVVVADSLERARYLTIRNNGDIYVALRDLNNTGGIAALRDESGNSKADRIEYFGDLTGTGIHWHQEWLYFGANDQIVRYASNEHEFIPGSVPEVMVTGFHEQNSYEAKLFQFNEAGNLYVNIGAPSNACQGMRRIPGSEGLDPCPQLDHCGRIWHVPVHTEQHIHEDGFLYVVQHGRDDLHRLWPGFFTEPRNDDLLAEEFPVVDKGAGFGWPYCYYDHHSGVKKLNPEYGGDGEMGYRCVDAALPIYGFPAYWASNDLIFCTGTQYSEKYRNGAFMAFQGRWNRTPVQDGFQVTFLPVEDGQVMGEPEMFVGDFTGSDSLHTPGLAQVRPTGLAMGPMVQYMYLIPYEVGSGESYIPVIATDAK